MSSSRLAVRFIIVATDWTWRGRSPLRFGSEPGGKGERHALAGITLGGAAGAQLTRHLDCEDRSYAYKAYYDGFNSGRRDSLYQWCNPRNGPYGEFRVGDYDDDPDGLRCSTSSQRIFVNGRPQPRVGAPASSRTQAGRSDDLRVSFTCETLPGPNCPGGVWRYGARNEIRPEPARRR
jgi:hypothetical protein